MEYYLFWFLMIFFTLPNLGTEPPIKTYFDVHMPKQSDLELDIANMLHVGKKIVLPEQDSALYRNDFIAYIKSNHTFIDDTTSTVIIDSFYNDKMEYVGSNKKEPTFLDDNTFHQICPFIIHKKYIDQMIENNGFLPVYPCPLFMNRLMYEYDAFKSKKDIIEFSILKAFNTLIKGVNFFRAKEKKVNGCNQSILVHILRQIGIEGFFDNDILYRGEAIIDTFGNFICPSLEVEYGKKQTPHAQIKYLKKVFKPRCYDQFQLKDFSGETKNKVVTFLLCLKSWQKTLKIFVPRPVRENFILNRLAIYERAQRLRPLLVEDIRVAQETGVGEEIKKAVEFIKDGRFLKWFGQKALW